MQVSHKKKKIVVLGDILLDEYIIGNVSRISPEAPVPVLLKKNYLSVPGGAANVAVNLATLGAEVVLIGAVGDDSSALKLESSLSKYPSIDISHFVTIENWPTIKKTRIVSEDHHQIVRIDDEKITPFPQSIENEFIKNVTKVLSDATVLVLSDYGKGVLSEIVLKTIIALAKKEKVKVIIDPKRKDFSIYNGADFITPNRKELAIAIDSSSTLETDEEIDHAAQKILENFNGNLLITRSEHGMSLCYGGEVQHYHTIISEVRDVSGAGDTVIATFAFSLAQGYSLESAVHMAMVAASIVIAKAGTAFVTQEELHKKLLKETPEEKLYLSVDEAKEIINEWRHNDASIVFTNGCFDILHPGHISQLQFAASKGDKLIVGLNSDASVKRLKGEARPIQDEKARAMIVQSIKAVDLVIIFDEDTPYELIKILQPDILVKGQDYQNKEVIGRDIIENNGGRVVLAPIIEGKSTTSIINKIKN